MRRQDELLGGRARVRERYALIPLEGVPLSRLPEWPGARAQVLASPALGAGFVQYRIEMDAGGAAAHPADGEIEHFLYVMDGKASLSFEGGTGADSGAVSLGAGGYALVPPSSGYSLSAEEDSTVLLLRKRYEPLPGTDAFAPLTGNQADVPGETYMGDPGALLQSLVPDDLAYDMAMNIFTFQTGHSLPVTETHVMEHGLVVLQGKGVYYLDDSWMEVEESDFIWMGPYCPQSYYAAGPVPSRYIYYKNVNREIPL